MTNTLHPQHVASSKTSAAHDRNPALKWLLFQIAEQLDRSGVPDAKFPDAKGEYWAHCPFHADKHASNFSVSEHGYHCFACGAEGGLVSLAEKLHVRLHGCTVERGVLTPSPYSLDQYSREKQLPVAFLRSLGIGDVGLNGVTALRIPYCDVHGRTVTARFRIASTGDKFRWKKGAKVSLYGLDRLDRSKGYVHLVEGESDTHTLWFYGEPALGVPGAATWKAEWARHLAGLTVYVWQEPDDGGRKFARRIRQSLPEARVMIPPEGRKDVSDCYLRCDDIPTLMKQLRDSAVDGRALQTEEVDAAILEARRVAKGLLTSPDILARFIELCRGQGLVGEDRTARLLYLALTSRLLERPVSVVVKGPSSGGKSFTVAIVLKAFPQPAYYELTGMTDHSLIYSDEPLVHRHLVLYEAAGMTGEFGTYLMRSLLSEGRIRYELVEKTSEGMKPRFIERAGPTGLILTTTEASLHPENETRMFSVTVRDTPEQTSGVLHALADRANGRERQEPDFSAWHALQMWLMLAGGREVTIPYAHELAGLIAPRAVRLRRDFGAILNLIHANAILHQATRQKDSAGRIIATVDDYAVAYELTIDIVSESAQASVKPEVRETVEAVHALDVPDGLPVSYKRVGEYLGLDKSAAKRRCDLAVSEGYLVNRQQRRGQPAILAIGDPLPDDAPILPAPEEIGRMYTPLPSVQPTVWDATRC